MASPLGHGLVGLALHVGSASDRAQLLDRKRALGLIALSLAPDLDLVACLFENHDYHRGISHSLGLAAGVGALVYLLGRFRRWPQAGRTSLLAITAWMLHGVVDFVSHDPIPPFGPMLFWPVSTTYWQAPVTVFLTIIWRTFNWSSVAHNCLAMLWEAALLAPSLLVLWRIQHRRLS